jgi:hypothetical protein
VPRETGANEFAVQTASGWRQHISDESAVTVRAAHVNGDCPAEDKLRRVLTCLATKRLTAFRAVDTVKAYPDCAIVTQYVDGVAVCDTDDTPGKGLNASLRERGCKQYSNDAKNHDDAPASAAVSDSVVTSTVSVETGTKGAHAYTAAVQFGTADPCVAAMIAPRNSAGSARRSPERVKKSGVILPAMPRSRPQSSSDK